MPFKNNLLNKVYFYKRSLGNIYLSSHRNLKINLYLKSPISSVHVYCISLNRTCSMHFQVSQNEIKFFIDFFNWKIQMRNFSKHDKTVTCFLLYSLYNVKRFLVRKNVFYSSVYPAYVLAFKNEQ